MTYEQNFDTVEAFEKALKSWRGKGWIFFSGLVADKVVALKTYNHTYLQILRVDGVSKSLSPMDCKVSTFNAAVRAALVQS
jgi:hypothetical protein